MGLIFFFSENKKEDNCFTSVGFSTVEGLRVTFWGEVRYGSPVLISVSMNFMLFWGKNKFSVLYSFTNVDCGSPDNNLKKVEQNQPFQRPCPSAPATRPVGPAQP